MLDGMASHTTWEIGPTRNSCAERLMPEESHGESWNQDAQEMGAGEEDQAESRREPMAPMQGLQDHADSKTERQPESRASIERVQTMR